MLASLRRAIAARGLSRSHSNLLEYNTAFPLENDDELQSLKRLVEYYGRLLLTVTRGEYHQSASDDGSDSQSTTDSERMEESNRRSGWVEDVRPPGHDYCVVGEPGVIYDHPSFSLCMAIEMPMCSWSEDSSTPSSTPRRRRRRSAKSSKMKGGHSDTSVSPLALPLPLSLETNSECSVDDGSATNSL
ncbi:hypothetical protein CLU79DRAFT_835651 [Phycomyces nitens]|nr:hypothetical protein CLU79DRAFT_835651 [Phycomyces nitens]